MALSDVVVRFMVQNTNDVERAFRTIEQAAARAGRVQATPRAVRTAPSAVDRNDARLAAVALAEEHRRAQGRPVGFDRVRSPHRMPPPQSRSESRAREFEGPPAPKGHPIEGPPEPSKADVRSRERLADREAKTRVRAMIRADREIKRIHDNALRESERSARQEEKIAERTANQRVRISEREQAAILREHTRRINQETSERRAQRESFARGVGRGAVDVGRGVASGLTTIGGRIGGVMKNTVGMVTQLGGGFGIADSVQRVSENAGKLEDILNSAKNPGSKIVANQQRREASDVAPAIAGTAIRFGMERKDIQAGLGDFTGITGDLETGMKLLPQMTELSRATGTSFADMANAAGNVGLAFDDMTDSGAKAEKIMKVLRTVAGQGKAGNIEFRDQATQAAKVIASAGKFEGDNAENIEKLGALMQFSRGGGGAWNAASAATAVTSFTGTFGKEARLAAFESRGINVFADKEKTKIRAPEELIADSLEKTGGNIPQMTALFGSVMGMRAVNKFSDIYSRAEKKEKGSGREEVLKEFKSMTKGVAMSKEDVTEAANRRTGAVDAQMAAIREQFDEAVAQKIIPELLKLVPVIQDLVPKFVDLHARTLPPVIEAIKKLAPVADQLINTFVDMHVRAMPAIVDLIKTFADFAEKNKGLIQDVAAHPVGALIGLEITKSFTEAALPALLKNLLTTALGGGGGGVPGGVTGGAGGEAGLAGLGVAMQGAELYNTYSLAKDAGERGRAKGDDLAARMVRGEAGAQREFDEAKENSSGWRMALAGGELGRRALDAVVNPVGAAGQWLGDKAAGALGFGDSTTTAMVGKTLESKAKVDEAVIEKDRIRDAMSAAVESGIRNGARAAFLGMGKPGTEAGGGPPAAASEGLVQRNKSGQ